MFTVEIGFKGSSGADADAVLSLMASWHKNGQIHNWHTARTESGICVFTQVPKLDALAPDHNNLYAIRDLQVLAEKGIAPAVRVIGKDPDCGEACCCTSRSSLVLFTTYLARSSPVDCGDCFRPVPLYELPHTHDHEHLDLLHWEADYKACDTLQMHCTTGERFGETQMGQHDSSLSRHGRSIAEKLSALTGLPVYYFLHKARGTTLEAELRRQCPSCGGEWLQPEPWHRHWRFKCDSCRLASDVACSLR